MEGIELLLSLQHVEVNTEGTRVFIFTKSADIADPGMSLRSVYEVWYGEYRAIHSSYEI